MCAKANKGVHPLNPLGTVLRTRMNADHADLNPRVSAQIRVPFSFCVFLKLKTSECERRILRLAGLESNQFTDEIPAVRDCEENCVSNLRPNRSDPFRGIRGSFIGRELHELTRKN